MLISTTNIPHQPSAFKRQFAVVQLPVYPSHLGRTPEGDIVSTWEPSKVMKRIQMLGAHEQVGFTDAPTIRGTVKAGPGSPMADTFTKMRSAFIIGGEPGSPGQGYIDPSVGNVTSRRVIDRWAPVGEELTGVPFD